MRVRLKKWRNNIAAGLRRGDAVATILLQHKRNWPREYWTQEVCRVMKELTNDAVKASQEGYRWWAIYRINMAKAIIEHLK